MLSFLRTLSFRRLFTYRIYSHKGPGGAANHESSRVHLRAKVTPILYLPYSKKNEKPGINIEIDQYSLFLNFLW